MISAKVILKHFLEKELETIEYTYIADNELQLKEYCKKELVNKRGESFTISNIQIVKEPFAISEE